MATYTSHYHLKKPEPTDTTEIIADLNSNYDLIDTNLYGKASTAHASTHITGGTDVIADVVSNGSSGLMKGADKKKLDDATNVNTANTLVLRDANARAQFADPVNDQDAVTKKYIKNFVTATITTTWTGSSPPYTQDISIEGITADHKPVISPVYSDTLETAIAQQTAWNLVDKIVTSSGKITVSCFTEKPITAIPIQIWVV